MQKRVRWRCEVEPRLVGACCSDLTGARYTTDGAGIAHRFSLRSVLAPSTEGTRAGSRRTYRSTEINPTALRIRDETSPSMAQDERQAISITWLTKRVYAACLCRRRNRAKLARRMSGAGFPFPVLRPVAVLSVEIIRLWRIRTFCSPITASATRSVSRRMRSRGRLQHEVNFAFRLSVRSADSPMPQIRAHPATSSLTLKTTVSRLSAIPVADGAMRRCMHGSMIRHAGKSS